MLLIPTARSQDASATSTDAGDTMHSFLGGNCTMLSFLGGIVQKDNLKLQN